MKKIIVCILLVGLGIFVWKAYKVPSTSVTLVHSSQPPVPTSVGRKIVAYDGVDGKTALDLLKSIHDVQTKTSSMGEYVESIDGIVGGVEGRYWIVYVDGQMANVGADKLVTRNNQKLEWKFETQEENGTK